MAATESQPPEDFTNAELHVLSEPPFSITDRTRNGNLRAFEAMMTDPDNISARAHSEIRYWADERDGELTTHVREQIVERRSRRWQKVRSALEVPLARLFGL
jgi:alkylhydroperoxidase family enzyme